MTKRKYFYTDPLAAAWMAKHFGMVFRENPPVDEGWVDPLSDVRDRYIVCPDSLPLVEPQSGDLIFILGGDDGSDIAVEFGSPLLDGTERDIIRRWGIPFFYPESESI